MITRLFFAIAMLAFGGIISFADIPIKLDDFDRFTAASVWIVGAIIVAMQNVKKKEEK